VRWTFDRLRKIAPCSDASDVEDFQVDGEHDNKRDVEGSYSWVDDVARLLTKDARINVHQTLGRIWIQTCKAKDSWITVCRTLWHVWIQTYQAPGLGRTPPDRLHGPAAVFSSRRVAENKWRLTAPRRRRSSRSLAALSGTGRSWRPWWWSSSDRRWSERGWGWTRCREERRWIARDRRARCRTASSRVARWWVIEAWWTARPGCRWLPAMLWTSSEFQQVNVPEQQRLPPERYRVLSVTHVHLFILFLRNRENFFQDWQHNVTENYHQHDGAMVAMVVLIY